jgi:cob(I)alamin adenosyltransferase
MGNRISKVYTRTGDNGTTGLADGSRVAKDAPEIVTMGSLDELNSQLGFLRTESLPPKIDAILSDIQHALFDAGGELSLKDRRLLTSAQATQLEQWLDDFNDHLAPLEEFILPGGTRAAAICHIARSVCRRAEVQLTTTARHNAVNPETRKYINRLSDLMFVMARYLNKEAGVTDVYWHHPGRHGDPDNQEDPS